MAHSPYYNNGKSHGRPSIRERLALKHKAFFKRVRLRKEMEVVGMEGRRIRIGDEIYVNLTIGRDFFGGQGQESRQLYSAKIFSRIRGLLL